MLDTPVIIRHLRGRESSTIQELQENSELATTMVNAFELFHGAYLSAKVGRNLSAVKGFLSTLEILPLDEESAEKSGEVLAELEREGKAIDPRDLFVGCTALRNGFAVLTDNRAHFERIPDLLVLSPSGLG